LAGGHADGVAAVGVEVELLAHGFGAVWCR
jgi:hypothetical protein